MHTDACSHGRDKKRRKKGDKVDPFQQMKASCAIDRFKALCWIARPHALKIDCTFCPRAHLVCVNGKMCKQDIQHWLRLKVPADAVVASEQIIFGHEGTDFADYTPKNTQSVDGFLYEEDDVDELCEQGKLARCYCAECGYICVCFCVCKVCKCMCACVCARASVCMEQ